MKWTYRKTKKAAAFEKQYGRSIQIGHTKYKLVFCADLHEIDPERPLMGLCVFETKTIFVDVEKPDPHETLIHEIVHAYVDISGVRQTSSWSNDIEEIMCEITSKTICHNYSLKKKRKSR